MLSTPNGNKEEQAVGERPSRYAPPLPSHDMTKSEREAVASPGFCVRGVAQVWHCEKTENNKCMSYHPRQHCILLSMRYLFIEYATSAGHHENMYTHRNEK